MKKYKVIASVLLTVLLIGQICNAAGVTFKYKKEIVYYSNSPVMVEGVFYIPVRPAVEIAGGTVEWDNDRQQVRILCVAGEFFGRIGSPLVYQRSAGTLKLESPVMLINGSTMVPLSFAEKVSGKKIIWDEVGQSLNLADK